MAQAILNIKSNEHPEDQFDEFTIEVSPGFAERNYEALCDEFLSVSEEELREIYRKAGEALGEL